MYKKCGEAVKILLMGIVDHLYTAYMQFDFPVHECVLWIAQRQSHAVCVCQNTCG